MKVPTNCKKVMEPHFDHKGALVLALMIFLFLLFLL